MTMRDILQRYAAALLLTCTVAAVPTMVSAQSSAPPGVTPTPTEQSNNAQENPAPLYTHQRADFPDVTGDARPQSRREETNPLGREGPTQKDHTQSAEVPDKDRVEGRDVMGDPRPQSRREEINPLGERNVERERG